MRDIIRNIQLSLDGKPTDFRLTKLDTFSGAALKQMLAKLPDFGTARGAPACHSERRPQAEVEEFPPESLLPSAFADLPSLRPDFIPAACPNLNEFLFLPVSLGLRWQHELWDGTYTLDDLLDVAELIRVWRENKIRAAEAARM